MASNAGLNVSRILGFIIILGSILVKVPQILKILSAESGVGVSGLSQFIELVGTSASIGYSYAKGHPFSSWGEALFLALQTSIIIALILHFEGKTRESVAFVVTYAISVLMLTSGLVPIAVLSLFNVINIPLIISARLIQAYENYRNESTGQLSAVTVSLLFAGSLARIFTSYEETGDNLLILIYVISSVMNAIILVQIIVYWDRKPKVKVE